MVRKKMTIEDLAQITAKGFRGVDERFDRVDKQIGELAEILAKFIKATDENFRHVTAGLDRVRDDVSDLPAMREELHALRARVERLERKI